MIAIVLDHLLSPLLAVLIFFVVVLMPDAMARSGSDLRRILGAARAAARRWLGRVPPPDPDAGLLPVPPLVSRRLQARAARK